MGGPGRPREAGRN